MGVGAFRACAALAGVAFALAAASRSGEVRACGALGWPAAATAADSVPAVPLAESGGGAGMTQSRDSGDVAEAWSTDSAVVAVAGMPWVTSGSAAAEEAA